MSSQNKSFDPNYVIRKYSNEILGEEVIYFPGKDSKYLLVCFSAMDINNRYNRLSWFWDVEEKWSNGFSFLYLSDRQYHYYLGNDDKPKFHTYEKIIMHHMQLSGVMPSDVYCIGSSMGGYAAIYCAFRLHLGGAITGVPQVAKRFARMHNFNNWIKSINSTQQQWLELDEYLYHTDNPLPKLYIEYGRYPADYFAAESLLHIYRERGGLVIANKGECNEHCYFMSPQTILAVVNLFTTVTPLKK